MSWTPEQLKAHPHFKSLVGVNTNTKTQATEKSKFIEKSLTAAPAAATPVDPLEFTVIGDPMGKPRMTQRDRWAQRPAVLRYRDYCDRLREAAPTRLASVDVYALDVVAHIAMPPSWSNKKKAAMLGKIHRAKPDYDNIAKAVGDALFKEDSGIADGRCRKFWCAEGQQRTVVTATFFPKTSST